MVRDARLRLQIVSGSGGAKSRLGGVQHRPQTGGLTTTSMHRARIGLSRPSLQRQNLTTAAASSRLSDARVRIAAKRAGQIRASGQQARGITFNKPPYSSPTSVRRTPVVAPNVMQNFVVVANRSTPVRKSNAPQVTVSRINSSPGVKIQKTINNNSIRNAASGGIGARGGVIAKTVVNEAASISTSQPSRLKMLASKTSQNQLLNIRKTISTNSGQSSAMQSTHQPITMNSSSILQRSRPAVAVTDVMDMDSDEIVKPAVSTARPLAARLAPTGGQQPTAVHLIITNLAQSVNKNDVEELCTSVPNLLHCSLLDTGVGLAVYKTQADADKFTGLYHDRELDDSPMHVHCISNVAVAVKPDKRPADPETPTSGAPVAKKSSSSASNKPVPRRSKSIDEASNAGEDNSLPALRLKLKSKPGSSSDKSGTVAIPADSMSVALHGCKPTDQSNVVFTVKI